MGNVLISFVIPMYNKEDYIRETINSIMNSCLINQFESYEIIVVDDESTDNSYESIKDYIASNDIKYYKQVNQGPSAARNNGLNKASGVYVIFVDADDIILPKYISFIKYAAEQEIKNL
jgi:glycosyltransferase involved in cell wall biosynthesis